MTDHAARIYALSDAGRDLLREIEQQCGIETLLHNSFAAIEEHVFCLDAERDALQQQVERLRAYSDDLAVRASGATRTWSVDADWSAEEHLLPGDLDDDASYGP